MATLIGWNLAALLKERGMSQKELAEAAGRRLQSEMFLREGRGPFSPGPGARTCVARVPKV